MMKLPTDLSGKELAKLLSKIGFVFQRQKGSRIVFRRESAFARVVIPNHRKLRVGTLKDKFSTRQEFRSNSYLRSDES